ncbi:MAG TPA: hypothetical protein VG452_05820 [Egibacteraceae bacterium]|nr:hypothetical protein [Egibacteraceae bacterium]
MTVDTRPWGQLSTPGPARLAAVAGHAERPYVDGVRIGPHADGRSVYRDDAQLVSHLDSSLRSASGAGADVRAEALGDLLQAARLTASTAVQDARTTLRADFDDPAGSAASAELDQGQRDLARAHDALRKGLPVAAVTHFGHAWQRGVNALAHVGRDL